MKAFCKWPLIIFVAVMVAFGQYEKTSIYRYRTHDIEMVIDRISVNEDQHQRIRESVRTALKYGKGTLMILDTSSNEVKVYSKKLMCPTSGISYDAPAPNMFSFNSPYGACKKCNGLGKISAVDSHKIIPDTSLSIEKGGIAPLGNYKNSWIFRQIEAIASKYKFKLNTPIKNIPEDALKVILYGSSEVFKVKADSGSSSTSYSLNFEGIVNFIRSQYDNAGSDALLNWAETYMEEVVCTECEGGRLRKEALYFRIADKNIADLSAMDISYLYDWVKRVESQLSRKQLAIAKEILKEIFSRLEFLLKVGLGYISLNRNSAGLSGGETQRIRLATQIGSRLTGVLYILDEPSIGLHQRDNHRLIESLKQLRDIGNSVIVVEHDKDMIRAADYVVDIGPGAGTNGGKIVAHGTPAEIMHSNSLTAKYLSGEKTIALPLHRRKASGKWLRLNGASGHNLKNVSLNLPLGSFICITGVSGSGKSSLISETLYPILSKKFYHSSLQALTYQNIEGIENLDKVIDIDQSPIGRTPRSNPATYTGVFTDIRNLFSALPEAKIRGYNPGRFSFNVKGGRCEDCQGAGLKTIEMNFLPDVYVHCDGCKGQRYNKETLQIRYRGKSINDVLNMPISEAVGFFENIPSIVQKIKTLCDVGLGYITLGQASTTLSGGEAQRVKLASELSKRDTGNTIYLLDEPTTGLHFEDVRILLDVINRLVEKGNTFVVIEHNLDVIKVSDYIIDIGPEGGNEGGFIVCEGSPEEIADCKNSHTAKFLKEELKQKNTYHYTVN
jgi:excinuclease ABC subunit A